jgi:crossover junction endodeoxyribonuclease RuvC
MIYLGVDPGLDGAMAVLGLTENTVLVYDTPTLVIKGRGLKRQYHATVMAERLRPITRDALALIERVHAMPKQGVRSMHTLGVGCGLWEGMLAALAIPYEYVTPQRWKKTMLDGQGKDKDAARFKAQALFPQIELHLKKHDGRADALLIAEFARRTRA